MYSNTATHTTLLLRLAQEDLGAWSEFCSRYGELIRAFCIRRGLQPADIEDVQQDVLISLTKSMPGFQYDPAKGKFRSYLRTVVSHAISRRFRQNPGHAGLSQIDGSRAEVPGESDEDEHWEVEWRQHHLRLAMKMIHSEFNDNDWAAFEAYALEGKDAKELAASLGLSIDAVYQAKSRILRRLTQVIEVQVAEEG